MGELVKEIGLAAEPSAPTALELALQRLGEGVFGKPRVGSDGARQGSDGMPDPLSPIQRIVMLCRIDPEHRMAWFYSPMIERTSSLSSASRATGAA